MNSPQLFIFCSRIVPESNFSLFSLLSGCEMTKIPFPLNGQTIGTIRASSTFLEKTPPPHFPTKLISGDFKS
ncbi:hypothetical protein Hanom_Chr12g01103341 [Helianthus anomalus]